uniref:Uncharacterized protein n=1 Tax=Anguilla anguilla TaxID=7936 RepID=A0A0E9WIU8_ANGAN
MNKWNRKYTARDLTAMWVLLKSTENMKKGPLLKDHEEGEPLVLFCSHMTCIKWKHSPLNDISRTITTKCNSYLSSAVNTWLNTIMHLNNLFIGFDINHEGRD